jgi:D-alanyl-lipoteichoic acid acyltransferase DltB (MBOAT superfamily)
MDLLLRPAFWLCALAALVLMRLPWPASPMRRFGVLNLLALALLLGWRTALGAALLALVAWSFLAGVPRGRPALALYVVLALVVFVLHKVDLERRAAGGALLPVSLLVRLAYSYVFLRLIEAGRAVAGGARLLDPLALLGYLVPFHMLLAGPVNVYREHVAADERVVPAPSFLALLAGVDTVASGLFYKLFVAEGLRTFAFGLGGALRSESLYDSALLFVYLFFDFAGYSLVALGLGQLLGVPTPVNFDRPFLARSLTEFWQRWHASLGRWVRAHLFVPLQLVLVRAWGVRHAHLAGLVVLVLAFGFVGLWHRLQLPLLLWGLGMGAMLALEKALRDRTLGSAWTRRRLARGLARTLGPAYVFATLVLSLHLLWGLLL